MSLFKKLTEHILKNSTSSKIIIYSNSAKKSDSLRKRVDNWLDNENFVSSIELSLIVGEIEI